MTTDIMQTANISWDELKSQYYHNLQNLQNSMDAAHNSSIELYRIYSDVMKKSRNTNPAILKKFSESWLKKLDFENLVVSSELKDQYNRLLKNSSPSEADLNDFEQTLQKEFKDRSLILLASYHLAMQGFFDTWMDMWSE